MSDSNVQQIRKGYQWSAPPLEDARIFYERCKEPGFTVRSPADCQATARGLDLLRTAAEANLGSREFYYLKRLISSDGTTDALIPVRQKGDGVLQVTWSPKGQRCQFSLITVLGPRQELVPGDVARFIPIELVEGPEGQLGVLLDLKNAADRPVRSADAKKRGANGNGSREEQTPAASATAAAQVAATRQEPAPDGE